MWAVGVAVVVIVAVVIIVQIRNNPIGSLGAVELGALVIILAGLCFRQGPSYWRYVAVLAIAGLVAAYVIWIAGQSLASGSLAQVAIFLVVILGVVMVAWRQRPNRDDQSRLTR